MFELQKFDLWMAEFGGGADTNYSFGALAAHVVCGGCPRWGVPQGDYDICLSKKCKRAHDFVGHDNVENIAWMKERLARAWKKEEQSVLDGVYSYLDYGKEWTIEGDLKCYQERLITKFYKYKGGSDIAEVTSEHEKTYLGRHDWDLFTLVQDMPEDDEEVKDVPVTPVDNLIAAYMNKV